MSVIPTGSQPDYVNNVSIPHIMENWIGTWDMLQFIWTKAGVQLCDEMFQHPVIQNLINSEEKYDLFITEHWGTDCFLGLAYKFGIPHVSMVSTMEVPWGLSRYGSPFNPALQTNHFTTLSNRGMNFRERLYNTIFTLVLKLGHPFYSEVRNLPLL